MDSGGERPMTYYPIRLPIKAWQYLGDGFGTQIFQDWIAAELPQYIDAIKCEELWQNSMLSITFPRRISRILTRTFLLL